MGGYNKRGYLNSDFKIFHLTDQISTEFVISLPRIPSKSRFLFPVMCNTL